MFQELIASGITPFYYSKDDSRTELDFIIDTSSGPTPIEVKSGKSLASKSFAAFLADNPKICRGIKLSILPYAEHERVTNLPLYLVGTIAF